MSDRKKGGNFCKPTHNGPENFKKSWPNFREIDFVFNFTKFFGLELIKILRCAAADCSYFLGRRSISAVCLRTCKLQKAQVHYSSLVIGLLFNLLLLAFSSDFS